MPNYQETTVSGNEYATISMACSLVLSYKSKDMKRQWSLSFQNEPSQKVIFNGDEPTTDEIIETLVHTNLPVYMVNVFKAVIGHVRSAQ